MAQNTESIRSKTVTYTVALYFICWSYILYMKSWPKLQVTSNNSCEISTVEYKVQYFPEMWWREKNEVTVSWDTSFKVWGQFLLEHGVLILKTIIQLNPRSILLWILLIKYIYNFQIILHNKGILFPLFEVAKIFTRLSTTDKSKYWKSHSEIFNLYFIFLYLWCSNICLFDSNKSTPEEITFFLYCYFFPSCSYFPALLWSIFFNIRSFVKLLYNHVHQTVILWHHPRWKNT